MMYNLIFFNHFDINSFTFFDGHNNLIKNIIVHMNFFIIVKTRLHVQIVYILI